MSQTVFCKDNGTVTISIQEYNKLQQYRELLIEMREVLQSGDSE